MKIALIRQRYTPFGGAERFVSNAVQALRAEGASLTVVTRQWDKNSEGDSLVCNPFYLGSLWRDWSFARCVCAALKKQSFDLVQSHERIACCDVFRAGDGVHREWLVQRGRALGMPGRIGIALNPFHHYLLAAEKKLFASPRLKAVVCNSRMVKEEIRHYFGLPEDMLHVIYSGVDLDAFHPRLKEAHRAGTRDRYHIPPDAFLYLFVGSGFERKGLRTLLQAMPGTPSDCHLMVVGKDKHLARYRKLAERLGVSKRVHFAQGQTDPKPFYGAADAFVLPTLYDPFPNTALEAFASGLPVITSSKSGAAEFVQDGKNGFVCDALDRDALLAAMKELMFPPLRQKRSDSARATVAPYSQERMSLGLLALYNGLLSKTAATLSP